MKKLVKVYEWLIYLLPAILFCSYYPLISLGANTNMNFELSLPLIWLVIFDIYSFVLFLAALKFKKQYPGITDRRFFFISFVPFFATVSIFWSPNPIRGILTAGILWAIFFAAFFIVYLTKYLPNVKITRAKILKSIFIPAIIISIWCWLQSILDLAGVSSEQTLMCSGCVYQAFGFPHPNGLAIEPQFMGNLLLAPALYIIYILTQNPSKKLYALGFFVLATLFLTFSRGAIYSFAVALLFMLIAIYFSKKSWKCLKTVPLVLFAFLFTLNAQGIFAAASKTNDTYFTGISKSLNQLSLGIIDISEKTPAPESEKAEPASEASQLPVAPESAFDGYVEESTDTRLRLSDQAVKIWQQDAGTMFVGVGVGGAGTKLFENGYSASPREIVQNEFFEILLELGIIGLALLIPVAILIFKETMKNKSRIFLFSLYIAFGLSFMFFSGLPNALHIFLLPALLKSKDDIITL